VWQITEIEKSFVLPRFRRTTYNREKKNRSERVRDGSKESLLFPSPGLDLQESRTNSIRYDRLHHGSLLHVSLSHGWGYIVHDNPRARKPPQGPVHENRKGRRLFFFLPLFLSSFLLHSFHIPWDTRLHATTARYRVTEIGVRRRLPKTLFFHAISRVGTKAASRFTFFE